MSELPTGEPISTIRVRLEVTPEDVTQAYRLHARSQLWSRAMWLSLVISLSIVAALCLVTIDDRRVTAAILAGSLVGGLLFPRAMIRWRLPVVVRRLYRQQRILQEPFDIVMDREGLRSTSANTSLSMPWSHYTRLREDSQTALLYQSDALFQIMPKRILTVSQAEAVSRWFAAAHAGGKT